MKSRLIKIIIFLLTPVLFAVSCSETGGPIEEGCESSTTFTDPRDSKVYKIVSIGDKIWMAENLDYVMDDVSYCYNNDVNNCTKYGRLYTWDAAIEACPDGWRLPTDQEWLDLMEEVGDSSGGKLKSLTGWDEPNSGATNQFCFSALPGGSRSKSGFWSGVGGYGYWWTSTENSPSTSAKVRTIQFNTLSVLNSNFVKEDAVSCRCVKD